ncbi:oligoendopeptidase F [Propionispora vibrioides]|uniref:Oligopeptidase F n=1 Tax=Propionispora vibrioides TaxID=112903 RepID=A0A1H8X273_9FIRM|nr:oligoendopeptidase F [Propionispora vibrioides]SEP34070.1 oligoendopeptidase F [Propionispora vibrioides]
MPKQLLAKYLFNLLAANPAEREQTGAHVPEREEIPAEYKWHLEDIYKTEELWQQDFAKVKSLLTTVKQYQGKLSTSSQTLADCLQLNTTLAIISSKLFSFARMHRDENTAKAKFQALTGQVESLLAEAGAATAFIEPEILTMADTLLQQYRKENQKLNEYAFYFENLARQKQHVLSPEEETILSLSSEATQAPETIFNLLAHADMKFPETLDDNGSTVQLSEGRYNTLIRSGNRQVRQQAFQHLFGTYAQYRNTFAATLGGNIKKNIFYAKTRKYQSVLASALESDNVPLAVYDNLIQTVGENLSPLHQYVLLKKRVLNLDSIHMYDLYTPLIKNVSLRFSYKKATELIKHGLSPLGEEYLHILNKGLTSGWIDVYENKGKQTGAYSWGTYGVHPFVLLNYHGKYDDVSTLAHEMGHALHSYYSHNTQPYPTASYTIFSAEVASTTNEILLLHHMLNTTEDKDTRLYLINQHLEQVRATVYRQTMFAEFEKMLYTKAEEGESITADLLDQEWHALNRKYYGPDIVIDKEINVEWARIPHFYWSFYVYQYVTGYSAATTLAEKILQEGPSAQKKYINFLKSGGSDYSINLLKAAGVDMSSPKPIEITLKKFTALLQDFQNLLTSY